MIYSGAYNMAKGVFTLTLHSHIHTCMGVCMSVCMYVCAHARPADVLMFFCGSFLSLVCYMEPSKHLFSHSFLH